MHLLGRGAERRGSAALQSEDALAANMERVAAGRRIEFADRRARLHWIDDDAIADQRQLRHMRRLGESRRDLRAVAPVVIDRDIARARCREAAARRRPAPRDAGRCAARDRSRPRPLRPRPWPAHSVSATTQAIASPTKRTLSPASTGPTGVSHGVPSRSLHQHAAFDRIDAAGGEIGRGIDRRARPASCAPPQHRPCGSCHARSGCARYRRRLAGDIDVVGVAPLAAQQRRILDPQYRLADAELLQRQRVLVHPIIHGASPQTFDLLSVR